MGADTIRLWAASVDYTRDVSIGPSALRHSSETLRKLRSSARFMLGNLNEEVREPAHLGLVSGQLRPPLISS